MSHAYRALLLLCLAGCARGGAATDAPARDLVSRYVAALESDDPHAAYGLLADGTRKTLPYPEFARRWQERDVERKRQAASLKALVTGEAQSGERGRLITGDGRTTELVRETTGWRLEAPLVATFRAATPQEALRQLAAALEERSIDELLSTLTTARRERLNEVLSAFSSGLRAHATDSVDISGDRATLTWSDGNRRWRVILKKEDGSWRIDDFSLL